MIELVQSLPEHRAFYFLCHYTRNIRYALLTRDLRAVSINIISDHEIENITLVAMRNILN